MTTLKTTTNEIIEMINPEEVLVNSSNYLQCIIKGNFCEFQKSYTENKWYQFKSIGKSKSPKEVFLKWI
jgi:hypothetical protein